MKYSYLLPPILIGSSIIISANFAVAALSPQNIEKTAREITLRIVDSQNPSISGSGVILKKSGNIYTAITAYHVVKEDQKNIITPDKEVHPIQKVKLLAGLDLALVEFQSSKNYQLAKIGDSTKATATTTIYVAGFPGKSAAISNPDLFIIKGQVNANGLPQREGYNILYDSGTRRGMSGGAVLNENGELVAIHGRADEELVSEKSNSKIITGLGITIYSFLGKMKNAGLDMGITTPNQVSTKLKADDYFIRADEKARKQNYRGAIADYNEAIRLKPQYAQAYNNLGQLFENLGDKGAAMVNYNRAIAAQTNYAQAYYNRATLRQKSGDKSGALADYNDAISRDISFADAYTNRGILRAESGDHQGAISDYNLALTSNFNDAETYYRRGISHSQLGNKQGAMADYNRAVRINITFGEAYGERGMLKSNLGDQKGAIEDLETAARLLKGQGKVTELRKVESFLQKITRK
jgi:tetratricopeptide (TPR) repeat protein